MSWNTIAVWMRSISFTTAREIPLHPGKALDRMLSPGDDTGSWSSMSQHETACTSGQNSVNSKG
jgi:hypothetical protein